MITVARVRTKIKTANIGRMKDFVPKDLTTCFVNAKYLVRFAFQVGIFRHHVHQPLYIYIYIYQFVFLRCTLYCYYIIVFISFNWCIYSISECVNKYYSCDAWAAYGFCERLQGYMTKHCAKACNTCGKIVTTRKTTPKPTTQATTRATTQATTRATTQATTKPTTRATTKPTTRATTKPTTQATTPKTTSEPQAITLPTKKFTGIGRVYIQLYMT